VSHARSGWDQRLRADGRLAVRAALNDPSMTPSITIIQVNEAKGGPATAAHLLEFDSVHGRWNVPITSAANGFVVGDRRLIFSEFNTPEQIPWSDNGVELVLECSGKFLTPDALRGHSQPAPGR
jgi:glyceraldehyde 3-phosphate dehydrogenase